MGARNDSELEESIDSVEAGALIGGIAVVAAAAVPLVLDWRKRHRPQGAAEAARSSTQVGASDERVGELIRLLEFRSGLIAKYLRMHTKSEVRKVVEELLKAADVARPIASRWC